jgi:RsmE family RNA methyltransferase
MNLVLIEPAELGDDGIVLLTGARAAHVATVLKTAVGETVRVGVVDGPRGVGTVEAVGTVDVRLRCALERETPSRPAVDLLLALPRPKVMRRLWAQLAALGIGRVVITNAARVERHYFDTHVLAPDEIRARLIEGLQQARDTRVPLVSVHKQFRVLVEDDLERLCPETTRLVADPASDVPIAARLRATVPGAPSFVPPSDARPAEACRVLLAIGPEGGWNAFELGLLASRGFATVGLGPRTLRSDTACVALLALVHDALREARAS